jgi:hypothetical protein
MPDTDASMHYATSGLTASSPTARASLRSDARPACNDLPKCGPDRPGWVQGTLVREYSMHYVISSCDIRPGLVPSPAAPRMGPSGSSSDAIGSRGIGGRMRRNGMLPGKVNLWQYKVPLISAVAGA